MSATVLISTGEPLSTQFRTEITALNRIDDESFQTLIDIIFNFLLASKQPDTVLEKLTELSAEIGVNFGALKSIVRSLLSLLKAAGSRGVTAKNINQDLLELGICFLLFCARDNCRRSVVTSREEPFASALFWCTEQDEFVNRQNIYWCLTPHRLRIL